MTPRPRVLAGCLILLPSVAVSWALQARAAVPAGYTGTPYQGTPQQIPGRVELANLDEGGLNVAFFADHRRDNAVAEGYSPVSGDDYRPGNLALPNICKTNKSLEVPGQGSEDHWEDGTRYPSEQDLYWYYMGYAHTVDWVRVTVNVAQAGKYNVSSSWACANPQCGLSIWFNDGASAADNAQRPLDGKNASGIVMLEGTNDYHKWRKYPNFAQVELSAGVQLMTFHVEVANHLQYGFLQFDLVGGGGQGNGGSGGTSAGGAPTAGASGSGALGGAPGSGDMTTQGSAGSLASTGGSGGAAPISGATSGQPAGGSGVVPAIDPKTDAGCALTAVAAGSRSPGWFGLLLALGLFERRRRAFACSRATGRRQTR